MYLSRSSENIAAVCDDDPQIPSISIRDQAQQTGFSRSTMHRILTKNLHLHAHKVQLIQNMIPADHGRELVNAVLERQHEFANFADRIIFTDGAHYHGFFNRQNCGISDEKNFRVIHGSKCNHQPVNKSSANSQWCSVY